MPQGRALGKPIGHSPQALVVAATASRDGQLAAEHLPERSPATARSIRQEIPEICGGPPQVEREGLNSPSWQEIRFDIDPACAPDIIGTVVDMSGVADASVDAIYSAHNLEHVFPHEVPLVLKEFLRILSTDGFVVLTCPDLQSVCEHVARNRLLEPLYVSPSGPIAPLDVLYGHRPSLAAGKHYMAHKCGFTFSALSGLFLNMGFGKVEYGLRKSFWRAQTASLRPVDYCLQAEKKRQTQSGSRPNTCPRKRSPWHDGPCGLRAIRSGRPKSLRAALRADIVPTWRRTPLQYGG